MASDIWLRTILIVRKETRCRHIGYSYRLTARILLYAPSHRQDNTYHGLCYTSRGALAGTRNSSMGPPHVPHGEPMDVFHVPAVLYDWCNKGRGVCYPVCGMVHIKEPLLLIGKSSPYGGSGFHPSLSE